MKEHERYLLSTILMDNAIMYKTSVSEKHFMHMMNRRIYLAVQKCAESGVKADLISIHDADPGINAAYLAEVSGLVPSPANWLYHEGKVLEDYKKTALVALGRKISELASEGETSSVIEMAETELLELGTDGKSRKIMKAAEVMPGVIDVVEQRYKLKGKLPGISTGLDGLDMLTGGLQDDRYFLIGARPSDGKSALAINMACNVALDQKLSVGFISAESSNLEIMTRVLSSEGRIPGGKLMTGILGPADIQTLLDVGARIKPAPLFLYDTPNIRFGELKSVARQMVAMHKVKVIFIDYIQIIRWEDERLAIHEQVAAVSRGLKQLARELKVPIVGLSQLKRDSEGREPELADLDYSKQLEQDGDVIVLIHHLKPKEDGEPASILHVKKNRDGAKGTVHVTFRREYVKFYEIKRHS